MSEINAINKSRLLTGLPSLHHIWCKVCKSSNKHLWFECPQLKCVICNGQHTYFNCNYYHMCQWCGSTKHVSGECNDTNGLAKKAQTQIKCFRCGSVGHIAALCYSSIWRGRRRRRFRRRRRNRRWRRRR